MNEHNSGVACYPNDREAAFQQLLEAARQALRLVSTMQGMPPSVDEIEDTRDRLESAIAKAEGRS